jgi:SAM-dependent methyltransferase
MRERLTRVLGRRAAELPDPPPPGQLQFGSFRRLTPVSDVWGLDRGNPIDRYYIDAFLESHSADIRGRVLEINDPRYTKRFGGDRVERSDVLHPGDDNPQATIIADLADAPQIADDSFDCIICTQTLLFVYDVSAAFRTLHRILAPGGVVLLTVPGICRITQVDRDVFGDWWRFSSQSVRRLFEEAFDPAGVTVQGHGNVLAAAAGLYGVAAEELTTDELDHLDPDFEVVVVARGEKRKPSSAGGEPA